MMVVPSIEVSNMSLLVQPPLYSHEVDVLAGALYAWCAERNIKLASQAGLAAANKAIDLYHAGHVTQDQLLGALHHSHAH
jgi:hypothetical protein